MCGHGSRRVVNMEVCRGSKDHLQVDKLVKFLTKRKHRNLRMMWIDCCKAMNQCHIHRF